MRKVIIFAIVLLFAPALWAQTTAVTATVTDAGAVLWKNGSYSFTFLPSPSNPTANYFQNGVPFSKNQIISGSLDNTASLTSIPVPDNLTIIPAGSKWTVQFCPLATATNGCYSTNLTITGATQNITSSVTPPAIIVSMNNPPPSGSAAYIDGEIFGARVGSFYFNLTDNSLHFCQLPLCTWVSVTGTFSGAIGTNQIAFASAPNTLAGSNNLTYTGGLFNINGDGTSTSWFTLKNATLATGGANQNSPLYSIVANYWNGAASVSDPWTFQSVLAAGTNPTGELRMIAGSSPGGELLHVVNGAFTSDGNINSGSAILAQLFVNSARVQGLVDFSTVGNTPASGGTNVSSGTYQLNGNYWNGAASIADSWTLEDTLGTGTNPTSALTLVHAGTPGQSGLSIPGITNNTGLQVFNTTTTCTTGAAVGATCTTAAITLPVAEADAAYRIVCTGKGITAVPVVVAITNSSATQFTITIAALTAVAASFASYDCQVGHS